MLFFDKIKKISKRRLLIGLVVFLIIILALGLLLWAILTGRIKFFAENNPQITNIATATFQDPDGNSFTIESNPVTVEIVPEGEGLVPVSLSLTLQGRERSGFKDNSSPVNVRIFPLGSTQNPIFEKGDVAIDANGHGAFNAEGLVVGQSYDFWIKPLNYLAKTQKNITMTDNTNLTLTDFKSGDLNNNNEVSLTDFVSLMQSWRTKTGDNNFNIIKDINRDGNINIADYTLMIINWRQKGE